jgi:hypothetical protein
MLLRGFLFLQPTLCQNVVCVGSPDYSMRPGGGFAKIAALNLHRI